VLYLDTAATTPVDPRVADLVMEYMMHEFGNAGSRTHEWGTRAKRAVQGARESIAKAAGAEPEEVVFTSGATESNNLALLGLAAHGEQTGRKHVLSSATEHKAVLEPLEHLMSRGFEVEFMSPGLSGRFQPAEILTRVRPDTLLTSFMLVNNETGVVQPVSEIARALRATQTFTHVDAAQGFAKPMGESLADVDLISISGHKLGAPKGVGALIARRRGWKRVPLQPLMFGGGQERKLRPGTVPVPLVVGLARAIELLSAEAVEWEQGALRFRAALLSTLKGIPFQVNGDPDHGAPHILNIWFQGIDSEALIVSLKEVAAVATGSACTSSSYTPSHVLAAMGLPEERILQSVRLSWWSESDTTLLSPLRSVLESLQH
jgi:cysteine desulfurase